jgi:hypothetical protein
MERKILVRAAQRAPLRLMAPGPRCYAGPARQAMRARYAEVTFALLLATSMVA